MRRAAPSSSLSGWFVFLLILCQKDTQRKKKTSAFPFIKLVPFHFQPVFLDYNLKLTLWRKTVNFFFAVWLFHHSTEYRRKYIKRRIIYNRRLQDEFQTVSLCWGDLRSSALCLFSRLTSFCLPWSENQNQWWKCFTRFIFKAQLEHSNFPQMVLDNLTSGTAHLLQPIISKYSSSERLCVEIDCPLSSLAHSSNK